MSVEATLTPGGPTAAAAGAEQMPARLVRAELRKILTTSTWWLFSVYALIGTGIALLLNLLGANQELSAAEQAKKHPPDFSTAVGGQRPTATEQQQILAEFARMTDIPARLVQHTANVFTSGQLLGLLLVALLGVLVVTNEFQHQTATATFLATPQRTRVITAKFVAAVELALCYWLLSTVVGVGIGTLNFSLTGYDIPWDSTTVWRAVAMNLLAYVVWAMLGVGLGVLIRSQLGATITAAALYLISIPAALALFGALAQITRNDVFWKLVVAVPGVASSVMVAAEPVQFGPDASSALAWWVGALVLLGYAAFAGVIGTLITRRRDIS